MSPTSPIVTDIKKEAAADTATASVFLRYDDQPFLDSKTAAPPRKYLDSVKNRMNIGIDARRAHAIRAPSSVCFSSAKPEMYSGSVLSFSA